MARELEAVQAERAGRSHIAPVTLVKLTTYDNRTTDSIDKVFYLSNLPCDYKYGAGATQTFLPVVTGGGDFFSGLGRLFDPDDLTAFGREFDLRLSNLTINGSRLATLLQAYNLEGASIQIAQLLLPSIGPLPLDLTSYDGDEHLVFFRGRVDQVAPITDFNLTLQCRAELPSMAGEWIYANDETKVDPLDVGKRLPRIYGSAKHVPVIAWEVGFRGTISEPMSASEDNIDKFVDSTAGLPSSPTTFVLLFDREKILCTVASSTEIHIEASGRGYELSTAATHEFGTSFVELVASPKWIASDQRSDTVPSIYVRNEKTERLVRIEDSLIGITVDTANTTLVSGRTVTSLEIDTAATLVLTPDNMTDTGASSLSFVRGRDGDYENTTSSHLVHATDSGWSLMWFDLGGFSSPPTDFDSMTFSIWITRNSSGVNEDILIKSGDGVETFGTIPIGSIPAAGSTPARFDFDITPADALSGSNIYIRVDPVSSTSSGTYRIFHAQISINRIDTSLIQEGTSITASGTVVDKDNAIDGDDDTFLSFTGVDNEYFEVTFNAPPESFFAQIVHILMDTKDVTRQFKITDGASTDLLDLSTYPDTAAKTWFHITLDGTDENVLRFVTNQPADFGDVYRFYRTVIRAQGAPEIPTTQLFADVDGVVAPGGGYQVSAGVLMEHPADIIKHWITVIGGETIDAASYSALVTALGASAEWGFDARGLGFTWEEVLQRMAFEARCNVIPVETAAGREWKLLSADSEYGFGAAAASDTIGQTHALTDEGRSIEDIASHFNFRYAFDASLPGGGSEDGFKLALLATPDTSDVPITTTLIGNAAARFGDLEAEPVAFRTIQDADTAKDVAGYMVQERMANQRRVYRLEDVAWFDALPYDVGDIVSITAPWSASATTCRIISMSKAFESNAWAITAVEVLETGTRT